MSISKWHAKKRLHVEMSLIKMTYIGRAVDLAASPQSLIEKKTNVVPKLENKGSSTGSTASRTGVQAPPQYKTG